ncbi:MAG: hypothetical protein Q8K75_12225 [Chlamydiales bacterium]|nr:hypothetical protein [Chlamydiales bacterium]
MVLVDPYSPPVARSSDTPTFLSTPLQYFTVQKACLIGGSIFVGAVAPKIFVLGIITGLILGPEMIDHIQKRVFQTFRKLEVEMLLICGLIVATITVMYGSMLIPVATGLYLGSELRR